MEIAEHSALLLEDAATAISPAVVVPQDHGNGKGKPRDPARQAQIPISEITNEKNSVRPELLQQLLNDKNRGMLAIRATTAEITERPANKIATERIRFADSFTSRSRLEQYIFFPCL